MRWSGRQSGQWLGPVKAHSMKAIVNAMAPSSQTRSDAKLLAEFLGMRRQAGAIEAALVQQGSVRALMRATAADNPQDPQAGIFLPKHRQQMRAAQALVLRYLDAPEPGAHIAHPIELKPWLLCHLGGLPHERFGAAFINAQGRLVAIETLFQGSLTQTHVYPRELVARALRHNAARLVLFHNHPSGSVAHSAADLRLTETLGRQLAPLDIAVWDHLIVAGAEVVGLPPGNPWAARWSPAPPANAPSERL